MTSHDACAHGDLRNQAAAWVPELRELEKAADIFQALADPLRLRLLSRLVQGEACVGDLANLEAEKLTTVSARLKALYNARLVRRRREAKHVIYALADEHVLLLVRSAIDHAMERVPPTAKAAATTEETIR
jgi:ArsR family transcriptional regulator